MSERMKKQTMTDYVEVSFKIPKGELDKIKNIMAEYGIEAADEPAPWREAFPAFHPGTALKGARHKEGITQRELASLTGVSQRHISEMENGKRTIGKAMAKRFARVLNVGYKIFL